MSLFAKIFASGESNEQTPTPQETIQSYHEIEDSLRKKKEDLEKKIEDQLEIAKANANNNKRRMFSLKKSCSDMGGSEEIIFGIL